MDWSRAGQERIRDRDASANTNGLASPHPSATEPLHGPARRRSYLFHTPSADVHLRREIGGKRADELFSSSWSRFPLSILPGAFDYRVESVSENTEVH